MVEFISQTISKITILTNDINPMIRRDHYLSYKQVTGGFGQNLRNCEVKKSESTIFESTCLANFPPKEEVLKLRKVAVIRQVA